jgi:hypothetical protein
VWVLPGLFEFYEWVTRELSETPVTEDQAQSVTLGTMLENTKQTEQGEYYRKLWVRVKTGVNMFVAFDQNADQIDEILCLWSILSTHSLDADGEVGSEGATLDHTLRADCLYRVLSDMLEFYNSFLQSSGISTQCRIISVTRLARLIL